MCKYALVYDYSVGLAGLQPDKRVPVIARRARAYSYGRSGTPRQARMRAGEKAPRACRMVFPVCLHSAVFHCEFVSEFSRKHFGELFKILFFANSHHKQIHETFHRPKLATFGAVACNKSTRQFATPSRAMFRAHSSEHKITNDNPPTKITTMFGPIRGEQQITTPNPTSHPPIRVSKSFIVP